MSEATLQIRPEIEILFYFPFNLGFSTAHVAPTEQGPLFQKIADKLNHGYADYEWSSVPYPSLPGTIVEGGAYLRGAPKRTRSFSHDQIEHELRAAGGELVGDVKEEVVYIAHGVGSVVLTLRVKLESLDVLAVLPKRSLKVIDSLRTRAGSIALEKDWKRFQDAMERAFTDVGTLYDMWGILLRGQEPRGFILCMSQAFLLRTVDGAAKGAGAAILAAPLEVDPATFPEILAPLSGFSPEENINILPHSAGVEFCAEGWDGEVAVISDPERESWVRFFWMFATCYWSVLSDLDAFLYEQTRQMARPLAIRSGDARSIMTATRRIQNAVALLAHEAIPGNIWDTQEQLAMHQGIFDAWGTEALLTSIERKLEYLTDQYENFTNLLRDASQERMNWVMTTFTFLTFAGVLADCISSIDFQGTALTTPRRMFLIFTGTIAVMAISATVGYIMHSRRALDQ